MTSVGWPFWAALGVVASLLGISAAGWVASHRIEHAQDGIED